MAESSQAQLDGTLEADEDPVLLSKEEVKTEIIDALEASGWATTLTNGDKLEKFTLEVEKGLKKLKLEVLGYRKISWANRYNEDEKRIQLGDFSRHQSEFLLDKKSAHKCLLLGLYRRNEKTIICAWDAYSHLDHGHSSTYVDVKAIAAAMRDGFAQSNHGKGLVCCFQPEFLAYYINNMHELHNRVVVSDLATTDEQKPEVIIDNQHLLPWNRIIYGAPGTGKSYSLNTEVLSSFPEGQYKRVTFYPDYSYAQFVGCYRPVPIYKGTDSNIYKSDRTTLCDKNQEPLIDYRFVPGPFLELLCEAKKHKDKMYVLIIEELNRADAPAVFGEAFQMLDRKENGEGVFPVTLSQEAMDYLRSEDCPDVVNLRLPRNLYLWATMNSADQGVMPLDAAFKRRWSFEYLPLNKYESETSDRNLKLNFLEVPISWNKFRKVINEQLQSNNIAEDRLIGPFFMKESELSNNEAFKNKLLLYLCDDVARHNHGILFNRGNFGSIVSEYDVNNDIFIESIHEKLSKSIESQIEETQDIALPETEEGNPAV